MRESNPFFSSIAFTFKDRYYFVKRDESLFKFYFFYWLIQPYKLLGAGWHLTSDRAGIQPIKNGIHRRLYKSVKHMYNWIKWDIKNRKRRFEGYFD